MFPKATSYIHVQVFGIKTVVHFLRPWLVYYLGEFHCRDFHCYFFCILGTGFGGRMREDDPVSDPEVDILMIDL